MSEPLQLAKPPAPREDLIARLEALLAEARSGELVGLFYAKAYQGGLYTWGRSGKFINGERMLGELTLLTHELADELLAKR